MKKRIFFIEGPNGCGKDYFIMYFSTLHGCYFPYKPVEIVNIKEYLEKKFVKKNKSYDYSISEKKVYLENFKKHYFALDALANQLKKVETLIVNRSYISFVIYNMLMPLTLESLDESMKSFLMRYKRYFNNLYIKKFQRVFSDYEVILVNLSASSLTLDTLEKRLKARQVQYNKAYMSNLLMFYRMLDDNLYKLFNEVYCVDSSEYTSVFLKSFFTKN